MKNFIFVSILFSLMSLVACQQNTAEFEAVQTQDEELTSQPYSNSIDVSEDMLQKVIASKRPDGCASRSDGYTLSTIKGTDGTSMIYVINFDNDGGFMLVSAKQSYHPVLAYSEEGNYKVEDKESNIAFYQDILVNNVELSTKMPEDSIKKYRQEWLQYKTSPKKVISRARPDDAWPDYWDETDYQNYETIRRIMMDTISALYSKTGIQIYFPDDPYQKFDVDPAVLEEALNACQGAVFYRYEDIWKKVSLVVYRPFEFHATEPNFIHSTWHQEYPYHKSMPTYIVNDSVVHRNLGCWTVAVGQVMRYYEWPTYITWNRMSYTDLYGTDKETQDFLAELSKRANRNFDGKFTHINDKDMMKAVKTYNYKTSDFKKLSNVLNVFDYIILNKPIIISGDDKYTGRGHAWVASGLNIDTWGVHLDVYTAVQPTKFVKNSSILLYQKENRFLFMNWGWGGSNPQSGGNGFYTLDVLTPDNHKYDPKSLKYVIIEPNK